MATTFHVVAGPDTGAVWTLPRTGRLSLGSDAAGDLVLTDPGVARRHCVIEPQWNGALVHALAPTFVNGLPIMKPRVETGDTIELADTVLVLRLGDISTAAVDQVMVGDYGASVIRSFDIEQFLTVACDHCDFPMAVGHLARIATALTAIQDLAGLGRPWLEPVLEALGATRGAVVLLGTGDQLLGLCGVNRASGRTPVRITRALLNKVLQESVAVVASPTRDAAIGAGGYAVVTPLRAFDRVLGALYVEVDHGDVAASDGPLRFLVAVGATAALALAHARQAQQAQAEAFYQRVQEDRRHRMIGWSPTMRRLSRQIARAAPTDSTILITGDSGTGKELVARAIHRNSRRASKPFVVVNCAAIPDTLLESELFGYERGAFSGAVALKRGRLELAEGGTLFLDEIGELSPAMQAKLLRVLQEHEIERLGGIKPIRIDFRLVAATNRDLEVVVRRGVFRQDLFFRLRVVVLHVPALRERREDIPALGQHFLEKYAQAAGRPKVSISPAALSALTAHDWPGNVRELEHAIERAVALGDGDVVHLHDLPELVGDGARVAAPDADLTFHAGVQARKKELILQAVKRTGGNLTAAAKSLGLHPNYLHRLIATLQLRGSIKAGSVDPGSDSGPTPFG